MIYRGYAIFRKSKGKIVQRIDSDPNYHGSLAHAGDRRFINLSLYDSLDNQVESVVHELLHLGYEYGTKEWGIIPGFPIPEELGITKEEAIEYIRGIERKIERD